MPKERYTLLLTKDYWISTLDPDFSLGEMILWFLQLPIKKQLKIIKPHYARWYKDQQIALEAARGDIQ